MVDAFLVAVFTHPDYASLVDPLCCAKRVRRFLVPSFGMGEMVV